MAVLVGTGAWHSGPLTRGWQCWIGVLCDPRQVTKPLWALMSSPVNGDSEGHLRQDVWKDSEPLFNRPFLYSTFAAKERDAGHHQRESCTGEGNLRGQQRGDLKSSLCSHS